MLHQPPFAEYVEEIHLRLGALEAAEAMPKVLPKTLELWAAPEALRRQNG